MAGSTNGIQSKKTTGTLIAVAAVLIVSGIVLSVAVSNRSTPKPAPLPGTVVDIGSAPKTPVEPQDIASGVPASGAARLQFADKRDPTRLQSELSFDKLDPAGGGYYTLDQPRAWVYLSDGRTLHISAETGRVKMPGKAQQPESGEFSGGVVVKLFATAPGERSLRPIDPDHDTPALLAVARTVAFDTVMLELTTDDPVTISTPALRFDGQGLFVRGNEVRERIELLRTQGRSLRVNPKMLGRGHAEKPTTVAAAGPAVQSPSSDPPTGAADVIPAQARSDAADLGHGNTDVSPTPGAELAASSVGPVKPARETLYKTVFSDSVALLQTGMHLNADTLELWTRVIDNRLPANAFGAVQIASAAESPVEPPPESAAEGPPRPVAPVGGPKPKEAVVAGTKAGEPAKSPECLFVSAGDEDAVLTWTGWLTMSPVLSDTTPEQLADRNHFYARFAAEKQGGEPFVRMADDKTRSVAACSSIEYAATSRTLKLLGGSGLGNVALTTPGSGRLVVPNLRADLGTGIGHVAGGGMLVSLKGVAEDRSLPEPAPGAEPPRPDAPLNLSADETRQITWDDQADFQFHRADGRLTGALDWAAFTGSVLARDRLSFIGGDFLRTDFASGGRRSDALRSLKVEGHVICAVGPNRPEPERAGPAFDPYLTAGSLAVAFSPTKANPDETEPTYAVASDEAHGASADAGLAAKRIEVRLGRDASGNVGPTDVLAAGNARFDRRDGVWASAEDIKADVRARTAELAGDAVAVGHGDSKISGTHIRLDDAKGTMIVDGPGTFEHIQPPDPARSADGALTKINASWSKGMAFDNKRGEIICEGQTTALAASPFSTQNLKSDRLVLTITPEGATSTTAPASPVSGSIAMDNRRLLRAEAIGSIVQREDGSNATVECRRYGPGPDFSASANTDPAQPGQSGENRVLEQVMYIEGPRISVDDEAGTMVVPAAGRAIIRDQRATTQSADNDGHGAITPGGAHGTSGFTWAGSMDFNRGTGVLTMRKDVELVHITLDGTQKTRLVANDLAATFASGSARGQRTDMVRAEAQGAVYVESGPSRLLSDRLNYDAQSGIAEAQAEVGNRVTLYDDRKPTPLIGRRLLWDLIKDRVEVAEPAPMTAPR